MKCICDLFGHNYERTITVINDNKLTLSDILDRFQSTRFAKYAEGEENEEDEQEELTQPYSQQGLVSQEPASEDEEEDEDTDESSEEDEGCEGAECGEPIMPGDNPDPSDLRDAADKVEAAHADAIEAATALRDMADKYIDKQDETINKEAEYFGECFADAAYDTLQKRAALDNVQLGAYELVMSQMYDPEDYFEKTAGYDYDDEDGMEKLAVLSGLYEDAYIETLRKVAGEEAYDATMQQVAPAADRPEGMYPASLANMPNPEQADDIATAQAVLESARAAREASEAAKKLIEEDQTEQKMLPPQPVPAPIDPNSMAAYQQTMQEMGNPAQAQTAEAYNQTMNEMAANQQTPPPNLPAATANAYDATMAQMQGPQG